MRGVFIALSAVATLLSVVPPAVWAQSSYPAGDQPGRIEKRFEQPVRALSVAGVSVPPSRPPQDEDDRIRFFLTGVVLDSAPGGITEADLLPVYGDSLGREISLTGLYALADEISARLQPRGLVVIPAQHIQGGVVHLSIIPGDEQ